MTIATLAGHTPDTAGTVAFLTADSRDSHTEAVLKNTVTKKQPARRKGPLFEVETHVPFGAREKHRQPEFVPGDLSKFRKIIGKVLTFVVSP